MEQNVDKPVEWNDAQPNVSWFHVLRLSFSEWPILLVGLLAAGIQGAIFPSFAIFFSQALEVFTYPFNEVRANHNNIMAYYNMLPPLLCRYLNSYICGHGYL